MTRFTRYNGRLHRKNGQLLDRRPRRGISQRASSQIIAALESQVGAVLSARTTRAVTLTEANHGARDMGARYAVALPLAQGEVLRRLQENNGGAGFPWDCQ